LHSLEISYGRSCGTYARRETAAQVEEDMILPEIKEPNELLAEFNKLTIPLLMVDKGNIGSVDIRVSKDFWKWMSTTLYKSGSISVIDFIRANSLLAVAGEIQR
jgi:hypothetical protein